MTPHPLPARLNLARWCLAANAERQPARVCLVVAHGEGREERWTYGAFWDATQRLAAALRGLGLREGDRVLLRLPSDAEYALVFFAAVAAGLAPLPTSSQHTAAEVAGLARDAGVAAAVVGDGLPFAPGELPDGCLVIDPGRLAALRAYAGPGFVADTAADDLAFLTATSGTSAEPKLVRHAHRTVWGRRPMRRGWSDLRPDDVLLHTGQLNWTYALGVGLMDPWAWGASAVLYAGPKDLAVWPRLVAQHGVTIVASVPTLFRQLLRDDALAPAARATLRHGLSAGEALPPALLAAWREAVGTELYEALGMSECSTFVSCSPHVPVRPGSPGRPQEGRRVAALPEDGGTEPLPPGAQGLLAVHRSDPGLMLGYHERAGRADGDEPAVWRGEWFVSADLVTFDEDGYVWHHGRADDVLNAFGYRVSPAEVERVVAAHPGVAECAVTEVAVRPDVRVIAAFVVPRAGAALAPQDVERWCAERLARYKQPRHVRLVAALPRSAAGKVLRRRLGAEPPPG